MVVGNTIYCFQLLFPKRGSTESENYSSCGGEHLWRHHLRLHRRPECGGSERSKPPKGGREELWDYYVWESWTLLQSCGAIVGKVNSTRAFAEEFCRNCARLRAIAIAEVHSPRSSWQTISASLLALRSGFHCVWIFFWSWWTLMCNVTVSHSIV